MKVPLIGYRQGRHLGHPIGVESRASVFGFASASAVRRQLLVLHLPRVFAATRPPSRKLLDVETYHLAIVTAGELSLLLIG